MILPGLVSVTFRKIAPAEIVALTRQAQLRSIEWGGDIHVPPGELSRATEVRQMTSDAGLVVSAYGSYYRIGREEELPFDRVLETAVALGAPTIRVWAGKLGSAQADATHRALIVRETQRVADRAAAARVSISFEFHGGTLTDTNESAGELLREVNHPNVFTFWQPPNGAAVEYCLAGLESLLPRLSNVHVFHWWPTAADRRPLAEGSGRWQRYLRMIQSTGRDHFASLEFVPGDSPAAFCRDAATLTGWLASKNSVFKDEPGC